jgi:hypothetical protein
MAVIAAVLAFVPVGLGIVSSMMIIAALSRQGKRINTPCSGSADSSMWPSNKD